MSRTIVITGASDGIGVAAARRLHRDGNEVVVVGRSPEKTRAVAEGIGVDHYVADFTRLDDVRALAADLDRAYPRIDVLANNAGGVFGDRERTADGFEKTFQVNHLAPFLLTRLLTPKLVASGASVIQTSSMGARALGRLDLDDLQHDKDFSAMRAYGTVKLENILFTAELHRRYRDHGLSAAAFHPGVVATSFAGTANGISRWLYTSRIGRTFMVTPEQGADQLIWLAGGTPGQDWTSGTYYEKRRPGKLSTQARDGELARRLWERSDELLGLPVA